MIVPPLCPVADGTPGRGGARPWAALLLVAVILAPATGRAWDAATTHAGLTESAATTSTLGQRLVEQLALPLGWWEPLRLTADGQPGHRLTLRLGALDPGAAYAPAAGRLTALGWLVAGSILEEVGADRDRHHYFDPERRRGLDQGGLFRGFGLRSAAIGEGVGTLRGLLTGASFDGTGLPSTAWLYAAGNDLSLGHFVEALERAVVAPGRGDRESALAEALLVAGALLHVVEDAGDPAHVRNDFRATRLEGRSHLARFVEARYGRLAVPEPAGPARPLRRLAEAIHDPRGEGLADRTARRFFSDGTLPSSAEAPKAPAITPPPKGSGYLVGDGIAHLLAYRRGADGKIHYSLDERCDADYAAALLPEVAQAALSALEHLFRGSLRFVNGTLENGPLPLGAGRLRVVVEGEGGQRREILSRTLPKAGGGEKLVDLPADLPAGRLFAVFRGVDGHGEELTVLGTMAPRPAE